MRAGLDIEVYHDNLDEYHDEEVIHIFNHEIETYDYSTGEYNAYDID